MQKGFFDTIPVDKIKTVQSKLVEFMETRKSAILDKVSAKRQFDEEVEKELKAALEEFKSFNTL
jgi:F-type H+-transporting ATPase subunit alpha